MECAHAQSNVSKGGINAASNTQHVETRLSTLAKQGDTSPGAPTSGQVQLSLCLGAEAARDPRWVLDPASRPVFLLPQFLVSVT